MRSPPLLDQGLLTKRLRETDLKIFFCGPGLGHSKFEFRARIRESLEACGHLNVLYGEDLERQLIPPSMFRGKTLDLQSLESLWAHNVDLTLLLLESPGSIAELGSFSMIKALIPRLIILVSDAYYNAESYIARGPLSIIARERPENVIYYSLPDANFVQDRLSLPIMFLRYARGTDSANYDLFARSPIRRDGYSEFITQSRTRFISHIALAAIALFYRSTFADLIQTLNVHPRTLSVGLKSLFKENKIVKNRFGSYGAVNGLSDPWLAIFDRSLLSRRRARLVSVRKEFA